MLAAGVLLTVGLLVRHRWAWPFYLGDRVMRVSGILGGVMLVVFGMYLLNLARHGEVVQRGGVAVPYR
jgi:hypothetical protein